MELGLQSFTELEDILANKIKVGSAAADELVALVETKISERLDYLEKDIVRKQRNINQFSNGKWLLRWWRYLSATN